MLDRQFLTRIQERYRLRADARRAIMKSAGDAQTAAKRAIFALHRDDLADARALLESANTLLDAAKREAGSDRELAAEGSLRAALEEFAEAALYRAFIEKGKVGKIARADIDDAAYLGGLADLAGELQRRQVKAATEGDAATVGRLKDGIEEIVQALLAVDLTGYLRTKFDQAKNALRRAEEVLYEISLRKRG